MCDRDSLFSHLCCVCDPAPDTESPSQFCTVVAHTSAALLPVLEVFKLIDSCGHSCTMSGDLAPFIQERMLGLLVISLGSSSL